MTRKNGLSLFLSIIAISAIPSSPASALTVAVGHSGGHAVIGIADPYGFAVVGVSYDGGETCDWIELGWGGLEEDTTILGTDGNDTFTVVPVSVPWCGTNMYPLNSNGYSLTIDGRGGRDGILNENLSRVNVRGGPGNDYMYNFSSSAGHPIEGGRGNDDITVINGDCAYGDEGDDYFNSVHGIASYLNGGAGDDTRMGKPAQSETSIENTR